MTLHDWPLTAEYASLRDAVAEAQSLAHQTGNTIHVLELSSRTTEGEEYLTYEVHSQPPHWMHDYIVASAFPITYRQ